MDVKAFRNILERIGFKDAKSESIKDSSLLAFLEGASQSSVISWLFNNLEDFETLSVKELEQFQKLEKDGKQIFEIDEIPKDLLDRDCKSKAQNLNDSRKDKEALAARQKHLFKQRKLVNSLLKDVDERVVVLEKDLQDSKIEKKKEFKEAEKTISKVDQKLSDLKASLESFSNSYRETNGFLSQLMLDVYFEADDRFTSSLTKYTKKQFFEGIADIVGGKDESKVELLDMANLQEEQDRSEISDQSTELSRLQSLYPKSQRNFIESTCSLKSIEAKLNEAENQLSDIVLKPVHMSDGTLIKRTREIDAELRDGRAQLKNLVSNELLPTLLRLAELESTTVLCGNYDLKIARQDYFLSKQDEVIKHLIVQSSRYDLLSMLFEIEAKFHRQTYYLLSAIRELIDSKTSTCEERIELMENQYFLSEDASRETIDSRDTVVNTIYDLFQSGSERESKQQSLFKSFDMLQENAERWHSINTGVLEADQARQTECVYLLNTLENEISRYEKIIFGYPGDENQKESEVLHQKIEEIEGSLFAFENNLKDVMRGLDAKKKQLSVDPLKAMERTLFPTFFQDPLRLRRLFSELESRAQGTTSL